MKSTISTLIKNNIDMVRTRNFDGLYQIFEEWSVIYDSSESIITTATQLFLEMGIKPWIYFKDTIPNSFAYGLTLNSKRIDITYPVRIIGADSFMQIDGVDTISLPSTITSIGSYAFAYNPSLKEIIYAGTYEDWKKIVKGYGWAKYSKFTIVCSDIVKEVEIGD